MENWCISQGNCRPLGATVTAEGCNFAVYCPDASAVFVCFFHNDTEEPLGEISLPEKTGDIWHGHISGITHGQLYGLRVLRQPLSHAAVHRENLLIDPYAKMLSRPQQWDARQYQNDSHFMIAKSVVIDSRHYYREQVRPVIPSGQRIIYEAHIKGLTKLHPDVPPEQQGTYLGAAHPSVIRHLTALGVTSVQFMPLFAFMPEPYITQKGLTNYWGYNPVSFFAPEPRYAQLDALAEIKEMVSLYHRAGLEVIVDVVFNHTAEGGLDGPVLSLKGTCPQQAYLVERQPDKRLDYTNYSGCGNTVDVTHPAMLNLIMSSLRYWYSEIGVDGFRFDLAATLAREGSRVDENAGFLRAVKQDPVLSQCVLIAEPWDIGPDGYALGRFGDNWSEVNDKYRDVVRAFWRGDEGLTAEFATRIMGSRDIFPKSRRCITSSVNCVTYHDGFTLQDLVSYSQRHNGDNKENNRDGHAHNLSANYGEEGPTSKPEIVALRERQKRNYVATLMLSQGTPHFLGGDELSRSQGGNNNAYCQDNPISWYNWTLNKREQDFLDFCQYVIGIRKHSRLFSELRLEDDEYTNRCNVEYVKWFKPDGSKKASEDWQSRHNQAFGLEIKGQYDGSFSQKPEHWFVCFNASDNDERFKLPEVRPKGGWTLLLDTRYTSLREQPLICIQQYFLQAGKSVALFRYSE